MLKSENKFHHTFLYILVYTLVYNIKNDIKSVLFYRYCCIGIQAIELIVTITDNYIHEHE